MSDWPVLPPPPEGATGWDIYDAAGPGRPVFLQSTGDEPGSQRKGCAIMSNYTKPEVPAGVPGFIYLGAEYVNGTGQTQLWVHDGDCADAGGSTECCTGHLKCNYYSFPWQEMNAIGMWMIEQADIARDRQLEEQG